MRIETMERLGRLVALAVGTVLLAVAVVTPARWWGLLGLVPLVIAFSGW